MMIVLVTPSRFSGAAPVSNARVTSDDDTRVTSSGDTRVPSDG